MRARAPRAEVSERPRSVPGHASKEGLLFVAKRDDGIEPGCLARRPDAEDDADREAEGGGDGNGRGIEDEAPAGEPADQRRDDEPRDDADQAAHERQGHGLDQELAEDVAPAGPERLADAD